MTCIFEAISAKHTVPRQIQFHLKIHLHCGISRLNSNSSKHQLFSMIAQNRPITNDPMRKIYKYIFNVNIELL